MSVPFSCTTPQAALVKMAVTAASSFSHASSVNEGVADMQLQVEAVLCLDLFGAS